MTAYFDDLSTEVRELDRASDYDFLAALGPIEARVIETVNLATGDREFPDDLREAIQGIIAVTAVNKGGEKADHKAVVLRLSPMIEDLHSAFHKVASRRVQTRFGLLTASPRDIVRRRDDHDEISDEDMAEQTTLTEELVAEIVEEERTRKADPLWTLALETANKLRDRGYDAPEWTQRDSWLESMTQIIYEALRWEKSGRS